MKRGSEYGMCPVFKWGKCVRQILGVMKRAVKQRQVDKRRQASTVNHLEKCSLVDVDQEKCSIVDVDH